MCKCDKTKEIKFEIFEQLPNTDGDNNINQEQTIQTLPHSNAQDIATVKQISDLSCIPNGYVINLTKPTKKKNKGVITVNHPNNNNLSNSTVSNQNNCFFYIWV